MSWYPIGRPIGAQLTKVIRGRRTTVFQQLDCNWIRIMDEVEDKILFEASSKDAMCLFFFVKNLREKCHV